jgi:predicted signal transduction protein with EAL and GGDEF domain
VWCVLFLARWGGPVGIGYAAVPLGGAVASVAVVRLLRGVTLAVAARRFWRSVLVALAFLTVGYAWDCVNAARFGTQDWQPDMPVGAAACSAIGFAAFLWAIGRVPVPVAGRSERLRMRLDRVIAFLGGATVLWQFGLAPMVTAADPWSRQSMVLIGLALLVSVGSITKVAHLTGGPVDRAALRLVAGAGLTSAGVAILAVTFGDAGGVPSLAVVMPLAPALVTLAVRAQWQGALTPRPISRRANTLLPYFAVAAADLPLIAVVTGRLLWTGRVSIAAAVVVSALVAGRQFLTFRDNARLLRSIRSQEERLQHEVTHDGLTGLANRALFRDRLGAALATGETATVLLIDLDDFKTVNDSLGHDVGDALLVAVAAELRTEEHAVRGPREQEGQAAGEPPAAVQILPVRLGGDEFALLLIGPGADGEASARRILAGLGEPIGEHRLFVQASIGIAVSRPGTSVDTLFREADVAMYAAKQRGKAGFVVYVPGMEEPLLAHAQLGGELRRALEQEELRVVYQPVMSLTGGGLVGLEALVRWDHPERGTVSPIEFIPAAERTGQIVPLGRFVLRESCCQLADWLAEFGPECVQKIGVNVSARQLHDPDFVSDVVDALADSGLAADRLILELTESAALRGNQISRTLHRLDALGVKLALDDFGTGESSLSLLTAFPAAIVKLDKSFVDGIEIDDPESDARQAVARAVIQLARALGRDTVAEGIENQAQADRLRELGYTLGQGYHLGRPMPPADLARLLARNHRDGAESPIGAGNVAA